MLLIALPFFLNASDFNLENFWDNYISQVHESDDGAKKKQYSSRNFFKQWFTGPLITPSPTTLPPGKTALGLGVAEFYYYGSFNEKWKLHTTNSPKFWSTEYIIYPMIGLTKRVGTEAWGVLASNYGKKHSCTQFQDTIYRLGYQISIDKLEKGNWVPDLRIIAQEIFPTGKYNKLNPDKEGIDATGQGSFQTGIYLAYQKGFKFDTKHAFNLAGAVGYFVLSSVRVKGQSFYGGTPSSRGRVYPGNLISIFSSGEFEISKHVALAYDSNCRINLSGKYKSKIGPDPSVKALQIVNFMFTPEIEVTVSENAGFLIGPWFNFAGQNTPAFASVFVAFMVVF